MSVSVVNVHERSFPTPCEKAGGTTVSSVTANRHGTLGNAGVYSDNLVEVRKVGLTG